MAIATASPYSQFYDFTGSPLNNGRLYFGLPNQNPETTPLTVFWDAAETQPAVQPIQTLNGYPVRSGTPAVVYANTEYSLTVRNRKGVLVFAAPTSADFGFASQITLIRSDLANSTDATRGAASIGFLPAGAAPPKNTVSAKLRAYKDSHDTNCIHDGSADTTEQLQLLLNFAWDALFYQNQVWTGVDTAGVNPVVKAAPGRFQINNSLTLGTGTSFAGFAHPANTVSHTRIIMNSTATSAPSGAGDNRNKPIIKFSRVTRNGAALANSRWVGTISNMEFWYVIYGSTFDNPLGGSAIPLKAYPNGGSLFIDVDMVDARFENLCFQHAPAAVRGLNVPNSPSIRGDGFMGSDGINAYFKGCEFDAGPIHLWFTNCFVDIEFDNCSFYQGASFFENCTGRVVFHSNCRFTGGAYVDASNGNNNFSEFVFNAHVDAPSYIPTVQVFGCKFVDIGARIRGASAASGIVLANCTGGSVTAVMQDSGYSANVGTVPFDFTAAVKLVGCQNIAVAPKISVVNTGASYNGFGILSVDGSVAPGYSAHLASANIIDGAVVVGPYYADPYNSQGRWINCAAGDIRPMEYQSGRPKELKSNVGLNLRGNTLLDTTLLGSAWTGDLSALLTESGVYTVTVEVQYQSNPAVINSGTFKLTKRAAGGGVVEQMGLANPNVGTGVISLSGTTVSVSFGGGGGFYLTVRYNRMSDGGID